MPISDDPLTSYAKAMIKEVKEEVTGINGKLKNGVSLKGKKFRINRLLPSEEDPKYTEIFSPEWGSEIIRIEDFFRFFKRPDPDELLSRSSQAENVGVGSILPEGVPKTP